MKYKLSNYCYKIENEKEYNILYSTFTGSLFLLEKQELSELLELIELEYDDDDDDERLIPYITNKIIVPESEDEAKNVLDKYFQAITSSDTLHLTIYITELCNFNCGYCFVNKMGRTLNDEKFNNIFEFINKRIVNYQKLDISWFGGEPLMQYEKLLLYNTKLRELCVEMNKGFSAALVTNGFLLKPKVFKELLNSGINSFQVTFDGFKEKHDITRKSMTGQSTFDKISNNLRYIRKMKNYNCGVTVRCNFFKKDDNLMDFVDYYMKYFDGDDRFRLSLKPIVNYESDDEKELLNTYRDRMLPIIEVVDKYPQYVNLLLEFISPRKMWCNTLSKASYVINPEDEIYICDSSVNQTEYNIGKIIDGGQIENDVHYKIDKDNFIEVSDSLEKCQKCKRFPLCYGSCHKIYKKTNKRACALLDKEIEMILKKYSEVLLRDSKGD